MPPCSDKKLNPRNERIKRDYLRHQKEARRRATSTIDGVSKALSRYEEFSGYRDFALFNKERAIAFKDHLLSLKSHRTQEPVSKSTILSTLNILKDFFRWLASQRGFKSRIVLTDIDYLNLSEKESRAARATKYGEWPTLEQVRRVISLMPHDTDIQKRNRALVAFAIVTGMRDGAMASIRLKHIDLDRRLVKQDPKEVNTKFSKRIDTFFFPVGDDLIGIVVEWIGYLRTVKNYHLDDPLFPQTCVSQNENLSFVANGLKPALWSTSAPIRDIFRDAFIAAGLPYFNPHSLRKTLVDLGQRVCRTPEDYKAWSQNLGHEDVMTTLTSYGRVSPDRQGEVIRGLTENPDDTDMKNRIVEAVMQAMGKKTT